MNAYQLAQVEVKAFQAAKVNRSKIVRMNAGLRMSGKAHLVEPLPELPAKPCKFLLESHEGDYIGTEWDSEFAHDYAAENGCKLTILPFDA
jgi:hypothetical protein